MLDTLIAIGVSLFAGGLVFCMALLLLGAHKGDAAVYPDCREEFFRALDAAANAAYGVRVWAPFCTHDDKRGVAIYAQIAGVPIGLTWSCYAGGESPCGECGACVERAGALT